MRLAKLAPFVLAIIWPVAALAQSGADVTLQLPSFSTLGVNTTVVVPDQGASSLARERQAFYERTMYGGLPNQRSLGLGRRSADMHVTAQVHDPRAAEAELLREVRERRATWQRGSIGPRGRGQLVTTEPTGLKSLDEMARDRAALQAAKARQAKQFLAQAREAYRHGKPGVAAVYYGMAANRADGDLKADIRAEARRAKSAAADASKTVNSRSTLTGQR